jgi:acetolactate synthase small subunit
VAAEPGALPRILSQLALRSLVPDRCHVARADREELHVDLQLVGLTQREAEKLAAALRRIIDVASVLVSMKDG